LSDYKDPVRERQENLRLSFRPARVRLLFIGESPPASGRFFYQSDSGLYRAMRDAFHAVDSSVDDANFLSWFQAAGCYLIDLCPEPVDCFVRNLRRDACRAGEEELANAISDLQPAKIATLLRSIEGNAKEAASRAGWGGTFIRLPYPGRWARHREAFLQTLIPALGDLMSEVSHFTAGQSELLGSGGGLLFDRCQSRRDPP
jgi:hypothetical protein